MANDYYAALGVARDATGEEIKRSYRKLARELHPDVNPDTETQERFKEVTAAYEVLSDPEKRQMYDLGADPRSPGGAGPFGPGAGGFENVPASWFYPIDLPTSMWVDLAVQGDDLTEVPVLLR